MAYNILFISHERKMGGANHSLTELVQGLKERGHNVYVTVLYRGCPIDKKLRRMGIETFPCFFGWWQQPAYWPGWLKALFRLLHWSQWISVRRIARFARKKKIDIIHSNSSVIDVGAQTAARIHCKHVWHFREYGEADYRLEYIYGKAASMDYACRNSDRIIFISRTLREAYREYIDLEKTRVIYNGAVPAGQEDAQPMTGGGDGHVYSFLVTGNISPGKNQKLVIEAVRCLTEDMKADPNAFQVHFAGRTTSLAESVNYMKEMELFLAQHGLRNVFFEGYVEDMKELRTRMDAEIVPSKSEAYGRVTLEAMFAYHLVIASDSGANPELIGEEERGLLFQVDSARSLAEKMLSAMNDDHTEQKDRAFEYVKKEHRREDACRKVLDVYGEIM